MKNHFKIDFFELSFLAEVCVPPAPIGRAMFWEKLINEYYHQMTPQERASLFDWVKPKLDLKNEACSLFYARYDPDNQFRVETTYDGNKENHYCFRWKESFRISKTEFIADEFITKVEKL